MNEIIELLRRMEQDTLLAAKNVLTMDDVALYTGYSKQHLYRLTSKKQIPHYKRGGTCFFDKAELEEWMRGTRISTDEEVSANASRIIRGYTKI